MLNWQLHIGKMYSFWNVMQVVKGIHRGGGDLKNPLTIISLKVTFEGETYYLETYLNEYRNLMMLIYDKLSPEDFGDCVGMGKCGTCLIEIESGIHPSSFNRNEDTTLLKSGAHKGLRLACQILIDEHIDGIAVRVISPFGRRKGGQYE